MSSSLLTSFLLILSSLIIKVFFFCYSGLKNLEVVELVIPLPGFETPALSDASGAVITAGRPGEQKLYFAVEQICI